MPKSDRALAHRQRLGSMLHLIGRQPLDLEPERLEEPVAELDDQLWCTANSDAIGGDFSPGQRVRGRRAA